MMKSTISFWNRLYIKMSILFSLEIILIFLSGLWISTRYTRSALESELDRRLWTLCSLASRFFTEEVLSNLITDQKDSRVIESLNHHIEDFLNLSKIEGLSLIDRKMKVLYSSGEGVSVGSEGVPMTLSQRELDQVWTGRPKSSILYEEVAGEFNKTYFYPLRVSDGSIKAAVVLESGADFLKEASVVRYQIEKITLFGILLTCLLCSFFAIQFIRPIEKLVQVMIKARQEGRLEKVHIVRRDEIGYLADIFNSMVDVLEEKDAELKRMYQEEKKKAENIKGYSDYLLGGISSGVISLDQEGRVITFNQSATLILEMTDIKLGLHINDFLGPEHPLTNLFEESMKSRHKIERREIRLTIKDDQEKLIGVSISPFGDSQDNFLGVTAIFSDITRVRDLERKLKVKDKLAMIGQVTANVAHEVRNPLGTLKGYIGLLKRNPPDNNGNGMIVDEIERAVNILDRIMTDFLSFARSPQLMKYLVEPRKLIKESFVFALGPAPAPEFKVEENYPQEETLIEVDPHELKKAFGNLIKNAHQAMQGKGMLKVSLEKEKLDWRFTFQDTGAGIPEEFLEKIFDPFFTTKDEGTGLGLSITHKIIEAHKGRIEVQSKLGLGTKVMVYIPIS